MATRKKKNVKKTEEDYGREFFQALNDIERERGISKDYMIEKITQALTAAYKKNHEKVGDNLVVKCDETTGRFRVILHRDVVEVVDNPDTEISLEDARRKLPNVGLGDVVSSEIKTRDLSRIAAQAARGVIIQGIREAEKGMILDKFSSKSQELITGVVHRIDANGGITVQFGSGADAADAYLPVAEQVSGEIYHLGDPIKVYVVEVGSDKRGPQVKLSRTHYGLVRRLFELEVPEIFDGIVEIKSTAREAGSRTKMAVSSADPNVDPIGACVGNRGARVNAIVEELRGEKVDIVKYSEVPEEFVAAALAPATVLSVSVLPEGKSCRVVVPDDQLSLAIGKEGQNARLAAKLTGYKIDIKPQSAAEQEPEELPEDQLLADEGGEEDLLAD